VLGIYAAGSIVFFGRGVLTAPATTVVGDAGADKTIFMWSLVWWPHALAHGHDPFDASLVWAPHGVDLAWATAIPGVGLAATPLTALVGPVAAYNVLVLAAPALSAWTAYLLASWVTRSFWPSLAAGWIFGFSAYEIGHMVGHLNLVLVFLVPLCALLVLRHHAGELGTRRFVLLLALALAAQFAISTEIFATLVLVGALFAVLTLRRHAMRRTVVACLAAMVLAGVVVAPYLAHAFVVASPRDAPLRSPFSEATDLLNYVVPTRRIWIRPSDADHVTDRFRATGAERGGYLGVPLLLAAALFAARRRRSILTLGLAALVVASLGVGVRIAGRVIATGPWKLVAKLPLMTSVLPGRLTLYVALLVALMVATWLADKSSRRRWALVLVGIALVLPNPSTHLWRSRVPNSTFFANGTFRRYLAPGDTALVLPFGPSGWSLFWQAETGMRFRLVGGHLGRRVIRAEEHWRAVYDALGPGPAVAESTFRRFLAAHGVDAIVVAPGTRPSALRLVRKLGIPPVRAADALVYQIRVRR
jgi:hypothetical protein